MPRPIHLQTGSARLRLAINGQSGCATGCFNCTDNCKRDMKTAEVPMASLRRQANPQRNASVARSWSQHIARETAQLPIARISDTPGDPATGFASAISPVILRIMRSPIKFVECWLHTTDRNSRYSAMSPMHDDGTRYRRLYVMPATKPGIFTVCPRRQQPGKSTRTASIFLLK
jgi:hypothetical protein